MMRKDDLDLLLSASVFCRRHRPDMTACRDVATLDESAAADESPPWMSRVDVGEALLNHRAAEIQIMTARMIVELPDGHQVLIGAPEGGAMGEIGIAGDVARKTKDSSRRRSARSPAW